MSEKKINGIICHAESCTYHTKDNCCEAGSINVTGCDCNDCEKHACETYRAKF